MTVDTKKTAFSIRVFHRNPLTLQQVFLVVNLVLVFKPWVM